MSFVKDIIPLQWCCYTRAFATFSKDRRVGSRAGPFSWWDTVNVRGKAVELMLLLN